MSEIYYCKKCDAPFCGNCERPSGVNPFGYPEYDVCEDCIIGEEEDEE